MAEDESAPLIVAGNESENPGTEQGTDFREISVPR